MTEYLKDTNLLFDVGSLVSAFGHSDWPLSRWHLLHRCSHLVSLPLHLLLLRLHLTSLHVGSAHSLATRAHAVAATRAHAIAATLATT